MKDNIVMPSPLPQFYEVQDIILKKIQANGHLDTIDLDASAQHETLRRLTNKENVSALEIAETLTLCRFNFEDHQEKLKQRTPEQRLNTMKMLQAESQRLLGLYEIIRTTHGENTAISAGIKTFLLDRINHQHQEDTSDDAVKVFLTNLSTNNTSNLEAPLTELVDDIERQKKILEYGQSRRQILRSLVALNIDDLYTTFTDGQNLGKAWDNEAILTTLAAKLPSHEFEKLTIIISLEQLEQTIENIYFDNAHHELRIKAEALVQSFKALAESTDNLTEVNAYIQHTLETIKNPTEENFLKLDQVNQVYQEESSAAAAAAPLRQRQ